MATESSDRLFRKGLIILVVAGVLSYASRQYVILYHPERFPLTGVASVLFFLFLGIAIFGPMYYWSVVLARRIR